jgi:endonuclease/exonuclease/phosphatase family metal-dependent hydrolase
MFNGICQAELRAMIINAEWLWTPYDKKVDGSLKHIKDMSEKDYMEELRFYAREVQARSIDILAISEIENKQVADELVHELNQQLNLALNMKWKAYFKQGRDTATGQDVAIISRLAFVEGSLTDFDFPAGFIAGAGKAKKLSKVVGAQFWLNQNINKKKIGVITAHLLSKRHENKKKASNREKQALGLKQAIEQFRKDSDALIVMGDFNDYLHSSTLNIIIDKQLSTYQDCGNFLEQSNKQKAGIKEAKRWLRHIDHLLYSGLNCKAQYKLDLQGFSDHPAIYGEFMIN